MSCSCRTTGNLKALLIILLVIMVNFYIAHVQCSVSFIRIILGHSMTCLFMYHSLLGAYDTASISALWTYRTHCHLCSTGTLLDQSGVKHVRVEYLVRGHSVEQRCPSVKSDKLDISLKILHQAGIEIARLLAVIAKRHAHCATSHTIQ